MSRRYSIAEARDRLAKVVHEVEHGSPVELTRRGKPVAVLLGIHDYQRLQRTDLSFTEAFDKFKKSVDLASLGIEPELFASARDRSPGRTVHF